MDKNTATTASLKLGKELVSLSSSALISLYTIDVTQIFDKNIDTFNQVGEGIFRFHNQNKLSEDALGTSIWFQGNEFIAAPIQVQGFEINAKGTLPQPKLNISVDDTNIGLLTLLKQQIFELGDLTGAKVIRQRTFAKFLDAKTFLNLPVGFEPDPNVEFPQDIYFIERMSLQNKYTIEYELSSSFDVDGVQLPLRVVTASKCMWQYRGCGCLYEYKINRSPVHGFADLPEEAPPLFTSNDEFIPDVLGMPVTALVKMGMWIQGTNYQKGNMVYLEKNGIKYWFVAKFDNPLAGPPNINYWIAAKCSKTLKGCQLHWDYLQDNAIISPFPSKTYPFGGFPAARKLQQGD